MSRILLYLVVVWFGALVVLAPVAAAGGMAAPQFSQALQILMAIPAVAALAVTTRQGTADPAGLQWTRTRRRLGLVWTPQTTGHVVFQLLLWSAAATAAVLLCGRTPSRPFMAALALGPFLHLPWVFLEELGWRGWLVPVLARRWGAARGSVVASLLWGLWLAPLVALGFNYPDQPVLGPVWMCGLAVIFGTWASWSRLQSGSLWPAVAAHAMFNAGGIAAGHLLDGTNGLLFGLTGLTGWLLPGLALLATHQRWRESPEQDMAV